MLRKILPVILAASLSSCASLPKKPSVELGVIDYPSGEVIVNMTGGASLSKINSVPSYHAVASAIVSGGNRVPLASYDRAIAFKPAYWSAVQNYMNALVVYIQNHCQGN